MKWILVGIAALGVYWGLNSGASSAPIKDFDPANLKVALRSQSKVVVVEYYSDT